MLTSARAVVCADRAATMDTCHTAKDTTSSDSSDDDDLPEAGTSGQLASSEGAAATSGDAPSAKAPLQFAGQHSDISGQERDQSGQPSVKQKKDKELGFTATDTVKPVGSKRSNVYASSGIVDKFEAIAAVIAGAGSGSGATPDLAAAVKVQQHKKVKVKKVKSVIS